MSLIICFLISDVPEIVSKIRKGLLENIAELPNHGHFIHFVLILDLIIFVINNLTAVFAFSTSDLKVSAVT